jgi:hypothetical protein
MAPVSTASAAPVELDIVPSRRDIFFKVRVSRRRFRVAMAKGWKLVVQVYSREANGWTLRRRRPMRRRRWVRDFRRRRLCRGHFGKKRVALQLGVRYRGFWWNRRTRNWQRTFVVYKQNVSTVQCRPLAADMPPGSLTGRTVGSVPKGFPTTPPPSNNPPAQPAQPAQPAHPPHGGHPGGHPGHHPPAQPQFLPVPRRTAYAFVAVLKSQSFDSNRLKVLRSWVRRLGNLRLRAAHIRRMLKTFSFDSSRVKAAFICARYGLKPFRASHIGSILRTFSFDSNRVKAARALCRGGIADPLNIASITKAFSFSSGRAKARRYCR